MVPGSWLAYFAALKIGPTADMAALDRLGLAFIFLLSVLVFRDPHSWRGGLGLAVLLAGIYLMASDQQPAQQRELSHVVGVVIGRQQEFPQVGLIVTVRDNGQHVKLWIVKENEQISEILLEGVNFVSPILRRAVPVGPVSVRPFDVVIVRVPHEIENVALGKPQVPQQLERGVRQTVDALVDALDGKAVQHVIQRDVCLRLGQEGAEVGTELTVSFGSHAIGHA